MSADQPQAQLDSVGARHGLGKAELERLRALSAYLEAADYVPTSARAAESVVGVHIADSLTALELDVFSDRSRRLTIADVGAGAGFPGLPLAIALGSSELRLVESQERKCRFMEGLAGALGVPNAPIVRSRVEEWHAGIGAHDVVLARALGTPALVLEYAAPLLRTGGVLIDWRGQRDPVREEEARGVARVLGLELNEIRRTEPFKGAHSHHLHLYAKSRVTPSRFPRRAGMARKRPLRPAEDLEHVRP